MGVNRKDPTTVKDYDEMDYGDELNDDEEKRYRKETYGGGSNQEDEEGEELVHGSWGFVCGCCPLTEQT